MPIDFDKQEYWHHRFTTETQFEWLVPSPVFMAIIGPFLQHVPNTHDHPPENNNIRNRQQQQPRILQLGFGTSDLQTHLRAAGCTSVLNIDYEPLAIERGRQLEKQTFGNVVQEYAVEDVTQLRLLPQQQKFDLVLDKSTVDAVSCGGEESFLRMVRGVWRCLIGTGKREIGEMGEGEGEGKGCWISLSYSSERFNVDGVDELFEVRVLERILTPKLRETDPDIYYWCYLLRPRGHR